MAAALICSCEKNEELDTPIPEKPIVEKEELTNSTLPEFLYAYAAGNGDNQTRTVVSNTDVLWNNGDNIFYCTGQTIGAEYKYEGTDAVAEASFEKVGDGNHSEVMSTFPVGVFPYRKYTGATFNVNKPDDETDDTWTITPNFEQDQNYVPNSFDKDANIMIATATNENNDLYFRNACGYVVVRLYGRNVTVKKVQLHANPRDSDSKPRIWGKLYNIDVDTDGNLTYRKTNPTWEYWQNMVEVNCVNSDNPQGVRISEDPNNPTEFWFALAPMVLKDGFYLRVEDSNGNIVGKNTDKSFEIERNKVKRMATIDASNTQRTHRLWYKTPTTDNNDPIRTFDNEWNSEKYFNAKIIAHTWDTNSPYGKDHKMYYIEFDRPLTEIKAEAFKNAGLTEIFLPEALTTIGESAFKGTNITTLTLPGKVTHIGQNAFADCENLTSVTFESSTTNNQMTIGKGAFQESGLTSISIPSKVAVVEQEAFADCAALASVTIEASDSPLKIGSLPFDDSDNITTFTLNRELVKARDDVSMAALFKGHTNLNSISLGAQVKTIHSEMFYNTGITQLTIPGTVTRIDYSAFSSCAKLATVTFEPSSTNTPIIIDPNSKYNDYTPFYGSNAIKTLNLNRELVAARNGVSMALFENHTNLTSVTLGEQVKTIHSHMFDHIGITSIEIPGNVTTIGSDAFAWCAALQSVTIKTGSERERSIGDAAFYECVSLNSIKLDGISTIGKLVFFDCKSLTSLEIPGSVDVIGDRTFEGCTGLTSLTFAGGQGSLFIGFNPNTNERGPFYDSPLTKIVLNRNLAMTEAYEKAVDQVDEGIFSYKNYSNHSTTLEIGIYVKEILPYMFAGSAITSITIPANVTKIGNYAFYKCTKLSKVTFVDSEQTLHIGYQPSLTDDVGPFWQSPLTEINIYRELAYDNDDVRTDEGLFANSHRGELVTKVDMGGHLRTILPFMFSYSAVGGTVINGNTVAGSVWIPHTITSIGNYAFLNCDRLAGLTMGYDGTTEFPSIGTGVFDDCDNFSYIKVRESVHERFITNDSNDQWYQYKKWIKWDDNFK